MEQKQRREQRRRREDRTHGLTVIQEQERKKNRHPLLLDAPIPHGELPQRMSEHTLNTHRHIHTSAHALFQVLIRRCDASVTYSHYEGHHNKHEAEPDFHLGERGVVHL